MVDRVLNGIYTLCGWLAALSLAMIAVLTLAQIVCRQLAIPLEMTELSGFCLAAATFFGLAHTLVSGDHVRVSLMEGIRSTRLRHLIEIWCCGIGAVVSLFATFGLVRFTIETYTYGDLSPGMMAVPLWMPQSLGVLRPGALGFSLRTPTGTATERAASRISS